MSQYDFRFERGSDGVAVLTFDRPDTLNSLTFKIYAQLERLFLDLEEDDAVKAIVITGNGRGFCSGGSVEEIIAPLLESELHETLEFTRMTGAVVRNMCKLQKPIVAAINGIAAGAGSVLALASDIRVMSENAKFAFLFTKVGLTGADMGAAWLLPRVVGTGRAMELLMLGDKIDAHEAHRKQHDETDCIACGHQAEGVRSAVVGHVHEDRRDAIQRRAGQRKDDSSDCLVVAHD